MLLSWCAGACEAGESGAAQSGRGAGGGHGLAGREGVGADQEARRSQAFKKLSGRFLSSGKDCASILGAQSLRSELHSEMETHFVAMKEQLKQDLKELEKRLAPMDPKLGDAWDAAAAAESALHTAAKELRAAPAERVEVEMLQGKFEGLLGQMMEVAS